RAADPLASLSVLRRPHDPRRDLRARLPAALPTIDANRRHQDRYVMTAIARLRRRIADRAARWSSTGCNDTRPHPPCHNPSDLLTAASTVRRHHQPELLLPATRVIARAEPHCAPSSPPSASVKSP